MLNEEELFALRKQTEKDTIALQKQIKMNEDVLFDQERQFIKAYAPFEEGQIVAFDGRTWDNKSMKAFGIVTKVYLRYVEIGTKKIEFDCSAKKVKKDGTISNFRLYRPSGSHARLLTEDERKNFPSTSHFERSKR